MKNNAQKNNRTTANAKENFDLETFDLEKAIGQDLNAAIHLLCLIRDTPELLQGVIIVLEDLRKKTIELQKEAKRQLTIDDQLNEIL